MYDSAWPLLRAVVDLASLLTAFAVAGAIVPLGLSAPWALFVVVTTVVAFGMSNLYAPRPQLSIEHELRRIVTVLALVSLGVAAIAILVSDQVRIGDATVIIWLVASALIGAGRVALYGAQRTTAARIGGRPALMIGAGQVGHLAAARRLDDDWSLGLTPIGFLDKEPLGARARRPAAPRARRQLGPRGGRARHERPDGRVRVLDRAATP